jgi:hypothetical protein
MRAALTAFEGSLRLQGYVGWLLTEPAFLAAAGQLAGRWHALPGHERPPFPLRRLHRHPQAAGLSAPSAPAAAFADDTRAFLDHWGLSELATWDLPVPQGPLVPSPLPPGAPGLPAHGVHIVLPLHYPVPGNDDLLQQILDCQRQFARMQALDESLAGLPHSKAYGGMLHVIHVERVARTRLGGGAAPRGFVDRLEKAIAAVLGGSVEQVRKLRKAIADCRRGRRARITWLGPRPR